MTSVIQLSRGGKDCGSGANGGEAREPGMHPLSRPMVTRVMARRVWNWPVGVGELWTFLLRGVWVPSVFYRMIFCALYLCLRCSCTCFIFTIAQGHASG